MASQSHSNLRISAIAALILALLLGVVLARVLWLSQSQVKPTEVAGNKASPSANTDSELARSSPVGEVKNPDRKRKYAYAGLPISRVPVTVMENTGYIVGYSDTRGDPLWVCYRLFRVTSEVSPPRPDRFETDARTKVRVSPDAYTRSGYDRGHLAPNYGIATRYGSQAQTETFLMSNIVPQSPNLNRGLWKRLEELEARRYAQHLEEVWVITGPVFDDDIQCLASGVEIPDACYKIMVDEDGGQPRVLALLIPQDVPAQARLESFLVSVDEVERKTGLDFLAELPDDLENLLEADCPRELWSSDTSSLLRRSGSWDRIVLEGNTELGTIRSLPIRAVVSPAAVSAASPGDGRPRSGRRWPGPSAYPP